MTLLTVSKVSDARSLGEYLTINDNIISQGKYSFNETV